MKKGFIETEYPESCRDCKHCIGRQNTVKSKMDGYVKTMEVISYYCYFNPDWRMTITDGAGLIQAKRITAQSIPQDDGTYDREVSANVQMFDDKPSWCPIKESII